MEKREKREQRTSSAGEEKLRCDLWLDSLWEFAPKRKCKIAAEYGGSRLALTEGKAAVRETLRRFPQGKEALSGPEEAEELRLLLRKKQITAIAWDDPAFPAWLKEIPDPPWMIYACGNLHHLHRQGAAIVGARRASEYGKDVAYCMGRRLAETGLPVISGMAMGIDAWAHRGALDAKQTLSTIAVLAGGTDICYPQSNRGLYEEILRRGLLLSEFRPGIRPRRYYFPLRNRIISGLSRAVTVVEAGAASGSLITAELAADQGREVFAIPGNINREGSLGTNKLIKDGAGLLLSVEDLLQELQLSQLSFSTENPGSFSEFPHGSTGSELKNLESIIERNNGHFLKKDEIQIIKFLLQEGELSTGKLVALTGLAPSKINGLITVLEMKGVVSVAAGRIYIAKNL